MNEVNMHNPFNRWMCNFSQVAGDATQMERIRAANGMRVWPSESVIAADVVERFVVTCGF